MVTNKIDEIVIEHKIQLAYRLVQLMMSHILKAVGVLGIETIHVKYLKLIEFYKSFLPSHHSGKGLD